MIKKKERKEKKLTEWEKIFPNHVSKKGLIYKIYKEFIQLNKKATLILKMGRKPDRLFFSKNKDILMTKRHMKRCLTPLIIRK